MIPIEIHGLFYLAISRNGIDVCNKGKGLTGYCIGIYLLLLWAKWMRRRWLK